MPKRNELRRVGKAKNWLAFVSFLLVYFVANYPAFAQITNGNFSAGMTGWTDVISPNGSVAYTGGTAVVTGDNNGGADTYTATQQNITLSEAGVVNFTLVSYSSTDSGNWDRVEVRFDGNAFGISPAGLLVTPGTGIRNFNQASGTNVTASIFLDAGNRTMQYGVFSIDSIFGPGIATWDDVEYQELTQSPSAQSVDQDDVLTVSASPQVASNSGSQVVTVTLAVTNGIVNLGSTSGITVTGGANGSGSVTFTGTAAQINIAMSGMTYTPNAGYSGSDTLVFTASGGGVSDTDNIPITVVPLTFTVNLIKTRDLANATAHGQTINYSVTLTSTGTGPITGINETDVLSQGASNTTLTLTGPSGDAGVIGVLDVGEVWTYAASHDVTQAQIDDGGDLVNSVTISSNEMADQVASAPATTITQTPNMSMTKTASAPGFITGDIQEAPVGTVVTYTYVVINNGNITVDDVQITDIDNSASPDVEPEHDSLTDNLPVGDSPDTNIDDGIWGTLSPGDSVTFTGTYIITQNDVDNL